MSYINTPNSGGGASHGNMKTYLIGLILSVILTVIPFWMVMNSNNAPNDITLWIVVGTAISQILVHFVCFLHRNTSSDDHWNLVAFLFTMLIIGIVVIGSLWIMYNLNINMMLD